MDRQQILDMIRKLREQIMMMQQAEVPGQEQQGQGDPGTPREIAQQALQQGQQGPGVQAPRGALHNLSQFIGQQSNFGLQSAQNLPVQSPLQFLIGRQALQQGRR